MLVHSLFQGRPGDQDHFQWENTACSLFGENLTKIWAWFWAYGPKASICYGWDFSGMGTDTCPEICEFITVIFCSIKVGKLPSQELSAFSVLSYLKLDDSLCVTSSCFPPFPPLRPSHPRDRAGAGRVMKLKLASLRCLLIRPPLLCPVRQVTPFSTYPKTFVLYCGAYIPMFYLPAWMSVFRWSEQGVQGKSCFSTDKWGRVWPGEGDWVGRKEKNKEGRKDDGWYKCYGKLLRRDLLAS